MLLLTYFLLLAAVYGHVALWVALLNRAHALPIPRPILRATDKPHVAIGAAVPLLVLALVALDPSAPERWLLLLADHAVLAGYVAVCWIVAAWVVATWLWRQLAARPAAWTSTKSRSVDVAGQLGERPIGSRLVAWLDRVPGHQMFDLEINEKTLALAGVDPEIDGLSVVHLSDLHFTGAIRRSYFEYVVDSANELEPDLVALTGDMLDVSECQAWFPATLGRLRARYGVLFVLGNHDKKLPHPARIRAALTDLGLIDVGGRRHVITMDGYQVLAAGNEWPWFGPRVEIPRRTSASDDRTFRLLLSHSPDQIVWARQHQFDLMLAGHTHGGQIRLPWVGPILSPSLYGVKYASGVFYESPTLLHVSRGISGMEPLRWNCAPELTRIVLRPQSTVARAGEQELACATA
jgi:predicted MPP superfamily phosphohydrolase